MKKIICFLLLISLVLAANMKSTDYLEATFAVDGYITGGEIHLHVPYNTNMQEVEQVTDYELFSDDTGKYIKAVGNFSFLAKVTVDSSKAKILTNPDFPLETSLYPEYTNSTTYITSDEDAIIQLATQLVADENNELGAITKIIEWVNENIRYDISTMGGKKMKAIEVYESKAGLCGEYSILTAALLRAVGIPTKYVEGFLISSNSSYQAHAWIEIYVPGSGWIPVDPTNKEIIVPANKIKIAEGPDPSDISDTVIYTGGTPKYDKEAVEISILSVRELENYFDLNFELSEKEVGTDSYLTADLELTNLKDRFLIPALSLFHDSDLRVPDNSRFLIVSPRAIKTTSFDVFTSDLNESYVYSLVLDGPGIYLLDNFTVNPAIQPEQKALIDVFISKYPRKTYVIFEVDLTNTGNKKLYSMELVIGSLDHESKTQKTSLMVNEFKKITFNFPLLTNISDYDFNLLLTADGLTVEKSIPLTITEPKESPEPGTTPGLDVEKALIALAIVALLVIGIIFLYPFVSKGKQPFIGRTKLLKKKPEYKKHLKKRKIKHSLDFLKKSTKEEHGVEELLEKRKQYRSKRKKRR